MTVGAGVALAHLVSWLVAGAMCARARPALAAWAVAAAPIAAVSIAVPLDGAGPACAAVVTAGSLVALPRGVPTGRQWGFVALVALCAVAGLTWPPLLVVALTAAVVGGVAVAARTAGSVDAAGRHVIELVPLGLVVGSETALLCLLGTALFGTDRTIGDAAAIGALALPVAVALTGADQPSSWVRRLLALAVAGAGLVMVAAVAVPVLLAGLGGTPTGEQRSTVVLALVSSAGAALAFPLLVRRLRGAANRLVYGTVESPDDVARTFAARLTRALPLDEVLLQLAETLRRALQLETAEVWTGADGEFTRAASVPHGPAARLHIGPDELGVVARAGPSGGTWVNLWIPALAERHDVERLRVTPLVHGGVLLGLVVTVRPVGGDHFDARDDATLANLGRQMGVALHNVALDTALADTNAELRRTNDELRASRTRIVASGDAERRRIERNLHDGAQQHLVALAIKVRLTQESLGDGDTDDALGLLDEIRTDLTGTIAELRALAHGVYPPLLASGGLAEALPAAAARASLPVTVERCPGGRFAQEVEATIYFCCLEALQNAAKHAGPGASAHVGVTEESGWVELVVADDGVGMRNGVARGQGLMNMADRVGAIGGTVEVANPCGSGTTVRARVPAEHIVSPG